MDAIAQSDGKLAGHERRIGALAAVDVLVVAGFVTVGVVSHGTNPLGEPLATLEAIAPFVLGWVVLAPLSGVYGRARGDPTSALRLTTVTWIAAANVGLVVRSSPAVAGDVTWPFGLVITGVGLCCLGGWRVLYAIVE